MKPITYGPECCLDTAVSALEKIFQKKVDRPPGRVFNSGVTATTEQKFSSPLATKPSTRLPGQPGRSSVDCRRAGSLLQQVQVFSRTYTRRGPGKTHFVQFQTTTFAKLEDLITLAHQMGASKGGAGRHYGGVFEIQTDTGLWTTDDNGKLTPRSAKFYTWEELEHEK